MRISSNLRAEQRLTVLMLFSLCLLCPLTFAQAQETKPAPPKKKTVTAKRVKRATLTAAAIRTLSAEAALARFAVINGNSITAVKGYTLLKLTNGAVLLTHDPGGMTGATVKVDIAATHPSPGIIRIRVCACSTGTTDNCQFRDDWGVNAVCSGQSCCAITCFEVDQAGNKADCPPGS